MPYAFVDTNILVYANDDREERRQDLALRLAAELTGSGAAVISAQVLAEYASAALNKLSQSPQAVDAQLDYWSSECQVVATTAALVRRGVELATRYAVHFYDAMILAAAESAGCDLLYSEDLNPGQDYAGVKVVNPFATS